ncbi:MAG: ubiquinol-cytochrome c reductase iron-sulfur subunit [Phycisphaerae bacterium]
MPTPIGQSERFKPPATRRDFLGLAATWSTVVAFVMAMLGSLRLPMPSVFPESDSKVKLGRPEQFAVGSATYFPVPHLWLFRNDEGFHAISSVCTHLGCITERTADGSFKCPCHGSKFDANGQVTGGPAPKGLVWADLSVSPEGGLVADTLKEVTAGTVFDA